MVTDVILASDAGGRRAFMGIARPTALGRLHSILRERPPGVLTHARVILARLAARDPDHPGEGDDAAAAAGHASGKRNRQNARRSLGATTDV
jgi:hypothetical protein